MATFAQRVPTGMTAPCSASSRRFTTVAAARRAEESATASPDPAEAARSGGRTGGSNFSRAKSAPAPARSQARPNVTTNTVVVAPSPFGFSPFGFSPFGMGGYGYGMGGGGMVMGAPMGGLSLILDFILIGVVFTALSSVFSAFRGNGQKKKDDDW